MQCCIVCLCPIVATQDGSVLVLQDFESSEPAYYPDIVLTAKEQELQPATIHSDLQHAERMIDGLNRQLDASKRSAAEKYSTLTRELEYMERVTYHWLTW